MKIDLHKNFIKTYGRLPSKIRKRANEKLAIFQYNPFEKSLNSHALSGEYIGYRSINVTGDYRAVFKMTEDAALFVKIGKHAQISFQIILKSVQFTGGTLAFAKREPALPYIS